MFPAERDEWLTVLRVGLGLQLILYALSLTNDWNYLLTATDQGLVSRKLSEGMVSIESPLVPRVGWMVNAVSWFGLGEAATLSLVWILLLCMGGLLLLGLFCRPAAVIAWLLHLSAVKSGNLLAYGVDNFTTIGLFYLMLSPLPDRLSIDWRLHKPAPKNPQLLGFWRRVLQCHLCLIYFFGGLTKCLGRGWWDGTNVWRALIRPPFNVISPEILVKWKLLFPFLGISVCLIEIGYAFFIWNERTRRIWLLSAIAMHAAIGITMGMYLFAMIMIVLNLAAFGPQAVRAQRDPVI